MNTLVGFIILGTILGFMALIIKSFSVIEKDRHKPHTH